jgi:hypothetical protein
LRGLNSNNSGTPVKHSLDVFKFCLLKNPNETRNIVTENPEIVKF